MDASAVFAEDGCDPRGQGRSDQPQEIRKSQVRSEQQRESHADQRPSERRLPPAGRLAVNSTHRLHPKQELPRRLSVGSGVKAHFVYGINPDEDNGRHERSAPRFRLHAF